MALKGDQFRKSTTEPLKPSSAETPALPESRDRQRRRDQEIIALEEAPHFVPQVTPLYLGAYKVGSRHLKTNLGPGHQQRVHA